MNEWTPSYQADFTKKVNLQLMAIIQRDIADALVWVQADGGTGELRPFVTYQFGNSPVQQFPSLLLTPMRSQFDEDAQDARESESGFYAAIRVIHQDPDVVALQLQDYLRAVDAIISTAGHPYHLAENFYPSLPLNMPPAPVVQTPGLAVGTLRNCFVSAHNYDEIRYNGNRNAYHFAATLEIRVERTEI
jgi:hypothetical protein